VSFKVNSVIISCLLCEDVARDSYGEDEEDEEEEVGEEEVIEPVRDHQLLTEKYRVSSNCSLRYTLCTGNALAHVCRPAASG